MFSNFYFKQTTRAAVFSSVKSFKFSSIFTSLSCFHSAFLHVLKIYGPCTVPFLVLFMLILELYLEGSSKVSKLNALPLEFLLSLVGIFRKSK